jgi:hypothetical protein
LNDAFNEAGREAHSVGKLNGTKGEFPHAMNAARRERGEKNAMATASNDRSAAS